MKVFTTITKVLVSIATIAGAIYLAATYGDKIVAWAKKLLSSCPCCNKNAEAEVTEEAPAEEEAPVEEAPAEEEIPAESDAEVEVVVAENEPVAEETDFEA